MPAIHRRLRVPSEGQSHGATYTSVCPTCLFVRIPVPQRLLSVFATRIGTSSPHWQPTSARYVWDRFAAGTTPRLPSANNTSDRVRIPWPKQPPRPKYERMFYFIFSHVLQDALKLLLKLLYTPQRRKT